MDLKELRRLVDEQAEDEGLWAIAETIHEAYIQQALRRLHVAVEEAATCHHRRYTDSPNGRVRQCRDCCQAWSVTE